eukprot:Pgem_evm1s13454
MQFFIIASLATFALCSGTNAAKVQPDIQIHYDSNIAAAVMDPRFTTLPMETQAQLLTSSSCSITQALKCAAKVGLCSLTCYDNGITSKDCMDCLGSSYNECKGCIPLPLQSTKAISTVERTALKANLALNSDLSVASSCGCSNVCLGFCIQGHCQ